LRFRLDLQAKIAVPSNKGMKLTKPGQLRSFAAYPRCSADLKRVGAVQERARGLA
jgi:hypothetical protein